MADLHYTAAQQNGTTSVTLSPAPSLDGHGSPPEPTVANSGNNHSSASSSGSGGNNSDDSEYDSVGESPERSPVTQSHSPPPLPQPQQLTNLVLGYSGSGTNSGNREGGSNGPTTSSGQSSPSNKSSSTFSHGASKSSSTSNDGGEYNNSKEDF